MNISLTVFASRSKPAALFVMVTGPKVFPPVQVMAAALTLLVNWVEPETVLNELALVKVSVVAGRNVLEAVNLEPFKTMAPVVVLMLKFPLNVLFKALKTVGEKALLAVVPDCVNRLSVSGPSVNPPLISLPLV